MKTFSSNLIQTEKFLRRELPPEESLVFEARTCVDEELRKDVFLHRMVHRLVWLYSRKQTKAQMTALHSRIFNDPQKSDFRDSILKLFNS